MSTPHPVCRTACRWAGDSSTKTKGFNPSVLTEFRFSSSENAGIFIQRVLLVRLRSRVFNVSEEMKKESAQTVKSISNQVISVLAPVRVY